MDKKRLTYTVSFERDAAGHYAVTFPAFPGLETLRCEPLPLVFFGAMAPSLEEAREIAVAKLASRVYELRKHGQPLPEDREDFRPHVTKELATVELKPRSVEATIDGDRAPWEAVARRSTISIACGPMMSMYGMGPRWFLGRWLAGLAARLFRR